MALLPVADALERLLADAAPLSPERVPIGRAAWRVLSGPLDALRTQPPFPASAMDGYAVRAEDIAAAPVTLSVIGEAPAGRGFGGPVGAGECVRIFTGAPVPDGADTILTQENATVLEGGRIEAGQAEPKGRFVRPAGLDFSKGDLLLDTGRELDPAALSLAAAANHAEVDVVRKPLVAILATGDELLPPGSKPGPDQIIASNSFGVAAIAEEAGADVLDLGIAADSHAAIGAAVSQARAAGADILVTLGGASVGDHDLVRGVLEEAGMALDFWKIAMRPGKPLMVGRLGETRVLGLPGNPVSSLVCSHLFLKPLIAHLAMRAHLPDRRDATLEIAMGENDEREDYVRAVATLQDGALTARPFSRQDSSMLKTLAEANALIVRPPHAASVDAGETVPVLLIRPCLAPSSP